MIVEPEDRVIVLVPEGVRSDRAHLFSGASQDDLVVRVNEVLVVLLKGRKRPA
jgi:hypothetical protein